MRRFVDFFSRAHFSKAEVGDRRRGCGNDVFARGMRKFPRADARKRPRAETRRRADAAARIRGDAETVRAEAKGDKHEAETPRAEAQREGHGAERRARRGGFSPPAERLISEA